MMRAAAFGCGLLFGLGLVVSQMVDPAKVLGFLDLTGPWDPTLGLVFLGALLVALPGMQFVLRRGQPVLAERLSLPERREIDWQLVAGSAVFGIGWGLAGFCPGPAIVALGSGKLDVFLFAAAMAAGILAWKHLARTQVAAGDG